MVKIASWLIFDKWDKTICTMPYNAKAEAERFAKENGLYVVLSKQPVEKFTGFILWVSTSERKISGRNEKTDEYWMKIFTDFKIRTMSETGIFTEEVFTTHRYHGETRVISETRDSESLDEFEKYAKQRWPTTYHSLILGML